MGYATASCVEGWRRARQAPGEDTPALIDAAADVPANPKALLDPAEHLDLQEAIEQLSTEHQAVASLRLLSGLTCRQIAEQLGCAERTVRMRLQEAVQVLKRRLGEDAVGARVVTRG